jgi:glycosyltransferase involved in cell wall biosynthesis
MQDSKVAFFSPLRYDRIYQRPQTLFDKLAARGHEVYYFQGPYKKGSLNHSRFGYHLPPAVERLDDHRKIVTVPRYFDFFGLTLRFTRGCMEKHVARWMGKFMDQCMGPEVIAFVETPLWWRYVRDYPFKRVFYDCIDGYNVLGKELGRENYDQWVGDLAARSDKVFVTSENLEKEMHRFKDQGHVLRVPNGVALEKFRDVSPHPEVEALKSRFKKVIGYVGVVHKWTDVDLVGFCADRLPDFAFVIVGPAKEIFVKGIQDKPNVFLMGRRPHHEIPEFIQAYDVCLNPFVLDEIGHDTNPVKLYEYLSLGKPVVSTAIHELKSFEGLIYSAEGGSDFLARLEEAAAESEDGAQREKRISFAKENAWDKRLDRILEVWDSPDKPSP